jgi:hypothetical protein
MNSQTINTGGGNYLIQVNDNNKVLIIGEGYVTVWECVEDFYKNLDGADNEPLQSMSYEG